MDHLLVLRFLQTHLHPHQKSAKEVHAEGLDVEKVVQSQASIRCQGRFHEVLHRNVQEVEKVEGEESLQGDED